MLDELIPLGWCKVTKGGALVTWMDYLSSGRIRPFELVLMHPRAVLLAAAPEGVPEPADPRLLPFWSRIANLQSLAKQLKASGPWAKVAELLLKTAQCLEDELSSFTVESLGRRASEPCESSTVLSGKGLGLFRVGSVLAPVRHPGVPVHYQVGGRDIVVTARRVGKLGFQSPHVAASAFKQKLFGRTLPTASFVCAAIGTTESEPWILDVRPALVGTPLDTLVAAQYPCYPTLSTRYPSTINLFGTVGTGGGGGGDDGVAVAERPPSFAGLNSASVSQAVVTDLLSTPGGALLSGGIGLGVVTAAGELYSLGGNGAFARPYGKLASGRHTVNLRSLLLCCPPVLAQKVHPSIRSVLSRNPVVVLVEWLHELVELDAVSKRLRRFGAFGSATAPVGLGFLPGTMRMIHQSWLTMRLLLADQDRKDVSHSDLFDGTLKGAAIFFNHIISSRGSALLGLHHMTLPEERGQQSLEDADGGGSVDLAEGTASKASARDETGRGSLSDAVWELLVLIEPMAYSPKELAAGCYPFLPAFSADSCWC
jgi:hypothetical protein